MRAQSLVDSVEEWLASNAAATDQAIRDLEGGVEPVAPVENPVELAALVSATRTLAAVLAAEAVRVLLTRAQKKRKRRRARRGGALLLNSLVVSGGVAAAQLAWRRRRGDFRCCRPKLRRCGVAVGRLAPFPQRMPALTS